MSIHVVGVIGLLVVFVIGTLRPVNLGALSLAMAFLVGVAFKRETPQEIFSGFPVDLFLVLAGVTYLFGVAASNGTVDRIVERATRLGQNRRALFPWFVFAIASLPAMAGALGSAGVAMLAPFSLRIAQQWNIDRRMIGLMVIYGAACGNFSPLNPLGVIVSQSMARAGLEMSFAALFWGNIAYNVVLGVVIYVIFGGRRLMRPDVGSFRTEAVEQVPSADFRIEHVSTLIAIMLVAAGAFVGGLHIGFLALVAAVVLHLIFPASSAGADKRIAWDVVLLICGIVTYVAALQRYGTVEAAGGGLANLTPPLITALLLCAIGAVTSAFASSAGIIAAMIPLAAPLMARGEIGATGMMVALAISTTAVDATPFSTVGALVVANSDIQERPRIYRGLLVWGAAMAATAPLLTWLMFVLSGI